MCSGFFELNHTDESLEYIYAYDEMKVILEGEIVMENTDISQSELVKARDAIFIPKGSGIQFTTPSHALAFYCGDRDATLL